MKRTAAVVIAWVGAALGTVTACSGGGDGAAAPFDEDASASGSSSGGSSSGGSSSGATSSSGGSSGESATCSDGSKNGGESDVDCGGPGDCARCALGEQCTEDGDCASGACSTVCVPKPSFTAVVPGCGAVGGGTALTLLGTNFVDAQGWSVKVGANAATSTTFVTSSKLTAIAPAGAAGKASVSIVGMPGGTLTLANAFAYDVSSTASPTFGSATTSGYSNAAAAAVGDVNGDGKVDYIQDHNGSHLDLLVNNGGSFTLTSHSASRAGVRRMVIADLNGDAKNDLVMTASAQMGVALNSGSTFGTRTDYTATTGASAVLVVDLNGDAKPEIVTLDTAADTLSVFVNNGDGTFEAKVDYVVPRGTTLASGDFDGDGKMDVVASSSATSSVSLLLGKGDGTLKPATALALTAPSAGLVVADFNADGKTDIVAASGGNLSTLFGIGNATFAAVIDTPVTGAAGAVVLRAADLDGDGSPDLAVLNQAVNQVEIWANRCGTSFASTGVTFATTSTTDLWLADLSGDGKLDVLYTSTVANPLYNARQ